MAIKKRTRKGAQKRVSGDSAKTNGRTILKLGKVGRIKLVDIRKAVLEVRRRRLAAGL